MGKKGTPHRKWSKEEKLYYIHLHLDEHLSVMEIERRHGVRNSLVSAWVKRYLDSFLSTFLVTVSVFFEICRFFDGDIS